MHQALGQIEMAWPGSLPRRETQTPPRTLLGMTCPIRTSSGCEEEDQKGAYRVVPPQATVAGQMGAGEGTGLSQVPALKLGGHHGRGRTCLVPCYPPSVQHSAWHGVQMAPERGPGQVVLVCEKSQTERRLSLGTP